MRKYKKNDVLKNLKIFILILIINSIYFILEIKKRFIKNYQFWRNVFHQRTEFETWDDFQIQKLSKSA
jgi:hypothetical protein